MVAARVLPLAQRDEAGEVGVLARIPLEVRHLPVDVELLQDDVRHRQREGAVRAGLRGQPVVGELRVAGEVGRDDDHLLPAVARFGHEMGVRGARLRDVRAPEDHVPGVPPVGRLGHVGLVAPDLRRRGRQVGVPVVERTADAADQRQEARARGVRDHRHGWNGREADDPVRAVAANRVDMRGGDQVGDLVPRGADETALGRACQVALSQPSSPYAHGTAVSRLKIRSFSSSPGNTPIVSLSG